MNQNLYLNKDFENVDGQSQVDFFALYANEQFRGYYVSQESEDSELYNDTNYSGNISKSTSVLIADYNNQVNFFKENYEEQIRGYNIAQKNSSASYLPIIGKGPYGGYMFAEPDAGYAMTHTYSLNATNWKSEGGNNIKYIWFVAYGDNIQNDYEYSPITGLNENNHQYNTTFIKLPVTIKLVIYENTQKFTEMYTIIREPIIEQPEPEPEIKENIPPWLEETLEYDFLNSDALFWIQFKDNSLQIKRKQNSERYWLYALYNVRLSDTTSNIGSLITNYSNAYIDHLNNHGDFYFNPFGQYQTRSDDSNLNDLIEITENWTQLTNGSGNNSFIDDLNSIEHNKDPIKLVYLTNNNDLSSQRLAYTSWYNQDSLNQQFIPVPVEYNVWVDKPENMQIEIQLYLNKMNYNDIKDTQVEYNIINLVNSLYSSYLSLIHI